MSARPLASMDHRHIQDGTSGDDDYYSDYENECEDDFEQGQLRIGLLAMDIGEVPVEGDPCNGVESTRRSVFLRLGKPGTIDADENIERDVQTGGGRDASSSEGRNHSVHPIRKNKRRHRTRRNRNKQVTLFVVNTCKRLQENKYPLMREAVDRLGIDVMQELVDEVYAIEKCGGQMVSDGSRRRNPGGVLWNILRERVGPQIYKEIMTEGNRKVEPEVGEEVIATNIMGNWTPEKQSLSIHFVTAMHDGVDGLICDGEYKKERMKEKKEREGGKRQRSEPDENAHNIKRQKTDIRTISTYIKEAIPRRYQHISKRSIMTSPQRILKSVPFGADNLYVPTQAQHAWAQAVRQKSTEELPFKGECLEIQEMNEEVISAPNGAEVVLHDLEKPRMTVSYIDLAEEGEISDSPIHGTGSLREEKVSVASLADRVPTAEIPALQKIGWQRTPLSYTDLVEEGEVSNSPGNDGVYGMMEDGEIAVNFS